MEDELTVIEVVLAFIGPDPVMMVKTAPTSDYDSHKRALAWLTRAKTGRASVIALHTVDGLNGVIEDADADRVPKSDTPTNPRPGAEPRVMSG